VELPARDHEKIVPLTRKPVWKFIDSVNEAGSVGGGIVFIDAHTGLRQKKILALRFTNIDWLNGEVAASKAVAKFSAEDGTHMWVWKIGPPKAQRSNRGVALPQSAIEPLSELRQTTKDPAGLLFPGPDSLLLDPDYFNAEIFAPIAQHAGMEGFRFQDLRHFFASMLILQGESPKLACAPMGHFSIQITFGTYGHRFPQAREEAAKKLQNAMFAGRREPFGNSLVVRQAKAASMEGSRARPNDRPRLLLRNGMIDKGRLVASVDWNH
jgi:Phage integrase family.